MVTGTKLSCYARVTSLLAAVLVLALPRGAVAQLSPTLWLEDISMAADDQSSGEQGASNTDPDELNGSLEGSGFALSTSVSFPPEGPPGGTVNATGSYEGSGLSEFFGANALLRIEYQIRVVQTAEPPVVVSSVPVGVQASGEATAKAVIGNSRMTVQEVRAVKGEVIEM